MKRLLLAGLLLCALDARADDPLRMKIGQMMILGFNGTTIDDTLRADLASRNLGGVVLMGYNCSSPAQIRQLTTAIKLAAQTPPLIATDEEGGLVARLGRSNGYASTVSHYTLGTVWNALDSTASQAARMAQWMSDGGFTTDFAPVVDVNVDSLSPAIGALGRSFSSDPLTVTSHASYFMQEFQVRQVITCLKHFPGHGSAGTDSHLTLPDITHTWADSELVPYRRLIAAGGVDMVMVGHLFNAAIDSVYPTSLSRNTVTGLLRDSLHYQGVTISDDFYNMKAITDNYGFGETAVRAVNAGIDILLYVYDFRNGMSLCRQIIDTLVLNVRNGVIPMSRIDEACTHIQQLKARCLTTGMAGRLPFPPGIPGRLSLTSWPNPFNPATTIAFTTPAEMQVRITVFDVLGRRVETIAEGLVGPGTHQLRWDAAGRASGVYFCRVEARPVTPSGASLVSVRTLILSR